MKRTGQPERSVKSADAIDQHVGKRVRAQRLLVKMTQQELGRALGLTFQQVQKYEKGINRIGASRLSRIATVLGVPVSFFYEGITEAGGAAPNGTPAPDSAKLAQIAGFLATPVGIRLTTSFMRIKDDKVRRRLLALMAAMSASSGMEAGNSNESMDMMLENS